MQQIITITQEHLDHSFKKCEEFARRETADGMHSQSDLSILGKVDAVWNRVRSAIQQAFIHGKELVTDAVNSAISAMEELLREAGNKAKEFHNELLKRLQVFVKTLIESALNLLPATMTIAGAAFEVAKVNYSQKLRLGGSLKSNLLEIISLTSDGEMSLSVDYTRPVVAK